MSVGTYKSYLLVDMHLELHKVNEDTAKVGHFLRVEPFQLYHSFISKLPVK